MSDPTHAAYNPDVDQLMADEALAQRLQDEEYDDEDGEWSEDFDDEYFPESPPDAYYRRAGVRGRVDLEESAGSRSPYAPMPRLPPPATPKATTCYTCGVTTKKAELQQHWHRLPRGEWRCAFCTFMRDAEVARYYIHEQELVARQRERRKLHRMRRNRLRAQQRRKKTPKEDAEASGDANAASSASTNPGASS